VSNTTTIETEVRTFLTDNFPLSAGFEYAASDSLIGVGAIDSTGVLELIEFIEERYEIQVPDEDVLPENLDSIEAIARYVGAKRAG
jgi:acyl carrier protein